MKENTWLKVVAIAMAVALVFTIVTSNIVSITAISVLKNSKAVPAAAPQTTAPVGETGSGDTQPVDNTQGGGETVDQTAATNATTAAGGTGTTPGGNTTTTKAQSSGSKTPAASSVPSSKADILAFYRNAVSKVKNNGAAGYTKKEWQSLDNIDVGNGVVNSLLKSLANNYMTTEDEVEPQVSAKNSKESKDRFPGCTMTDVKYLQSATCKESGNNYEIKLVVVDDDTPKKNSNVLGQITNSVLYWEDIKAEIDNISQVESVDESKTHVYYNDFTITCTITKDGKFVSMRHFATVDITAVAVMKVGFKFDLNAKAQLLNYCDYSDFKY